ncbi:MAG: hypothetical protein H8E98_07900 [Bacteroidetes bacterium]|nr:hypothetical protein [Bacteroidota bacterium]
MAKFEKQAFERASAIMTGHVRKKLETQTDSRVLWVFENASTMSSAITRIQANSDYTGFRDIFLFKTIKGLAREFEGDWRTFDGLTVDFQGRDLVLV